VNRRTYLGVCAGVGASALSGCIDAVASGVTRTAATPAFLMPPADGGAGTEGEVWRPRRIHAVRPLDVEVDVGVPALGSVRIRGWFTGSQLRATSHNASRSNRSSGLAGPDAGADGIDDEADGDGAASAGGTRATDYNSSRSNTEGVSDDGDGSGDDDAEKCRDSPSAGALGGAGSTDLLRLPQWYPTWLAWTPGRRCSSEASSPPSAFWRPA
jgi:hypothetical protein